jgi:flagellar export protein FliJ
VDALAVLARLARQALDEERQRLLGTDEAIAAVCDQRAGLREAAELERRAAGGFTDGNARIVTYLRRVAARAQRLQAELRRLEHQRAAEAARLAERHVELKRLEILVERRAERARAERIRREQQTTDELVVLRQHRQRLLTR